MNEKLQAMLDHYEITRVLTEYCHGCDRADQVQMASVYAEDSWDDHGTYKGQGKPFAAYTTRTIATTLNTCSHQLGQSMIHVDGDTAGAETYFIATLRYPPEGDGPEYLNQLGGRYVDKLERIDGDWKIKSRVCVLDWSISHQLRENWLKDDPFIRGQANGQDASYDVLRLAHSGLPAAQPAG